MSPSLSSLLVLTSLHWRKRMTTAIPEDVLVIQKTAPFWGHQRRPGSFASTPPVLGFVCDGKQHLHMPNDYFPKPTCLISSFGTNTTPRWSCACRSHQQRKYPGKTCHHIVSAPYSKICMQDFPRASSYSKAQHHFSKIAGWLWNQVQSLCLGSLQSKPARIWLFTVSAPTAVISTLIYRWQKMFFTLSHQGTSSVYRSLSDFCLSQTLWLQAVWLQSKVQILNDH